MKGPPLGQANIGALAGAIGGAMGGLFGVGIPSAVIGRNAALLFDTPIVALFCFCVCGLFGWLLGGQLGPRLGQKLDHQRGEIIGGLLGGLFPVSVTILWGWYMVAAH